jgi:hypothetical protein
VTSSRSAKRALNFEITLDDLKLFAQRGVTISRVEHVPQQFAECRDQPHYGGRISCARQRGNAVQAVEEKVRLQVPAQGLQARGCEFGLQSRGRYLSILVALVERHGRARCCN